MLIRRDVFRGLSGLAVSPLFLHSLSAEAANTTATDTIMVVINMAGGNDGLNTVIPLTKFPAYRTLRRPATPPDASLTLDYTIPQLAATAFDPNPATPAANASQFAFAPSMTAMRDLYSTGKLAVLNGISLPLTEQASLSHSDASRDWQTGQINTTLSTPPGWIGLALNGALAGSLGATTSMSGGSPIVLQNGVAQSLVLSPSIDNFNFSYGSSDNYTKLVQSFNHIMTLPTSDASTAYNLSTLLGAKNAVTVVNKIANANKVKGYPTPVTWIDYQLHDIARMILGQSGVRGYYAEYGGFDTHSQQALYQPQYLADISNAMQTFYTYLQAHGASANVVIATISDFGRRPGANLNFGTDHGAGSVAFVLGDRVTGGVYGNYPSLTKFDVYGNLKMTVDFRNMISDLIVAMGGNAKTILGQTYPKLGFI